MIIFLQFGNVRELDESFHLGNGHPEDLLHPVEEAVDRVGFFEHRVGHVVCFSPPGLVGGLFRFFHLLRGRRCRGGLGNLWLVGFLLLEVTFEETGMKRKNSAKERPKTIEKRGRCGCLKLFAYTGCYKKYAPKNIPYETRRFFEYFSTRTTKIG